MANTNIPLVGLVGWRGMVGSVLMERMLAEKDFDLIEPVFFSTSQAGGEVPLLNGKKLLRVRALCRMLMTSKHCHVATSS